MRWFTALVILWVCWTASGCATGLQGVALLAGAQPAVRQPTSSEFASVVQNYSALAARRSRPDARDHLVTASDGGVIVSDGQMASRNVREELPENGTPVRPVPPLPPAADPTFAENRPNEDLTGGETLAYAAPNSLVQSQQVPVPPEPQDIVAGSDDEDETPFDAHLPAGPQPDVEAERWAADEPYRDSPTGADPQAGIVAEEHPSAEAETHVAREPVPTALAVDATSPDALWTDPPPHLVAAAEQGEVVASPPPEPAGKFKSRDEDSDIQRFSQQVADLPLDIRPPEGVLPTDLAAHEFEQHAIVDPRQSYDGPEIFCSYTPWTICFRPLYFEEVALERYGQKLRFIQPGASAVQFLKNVALLPYKMRVRPPRSYVCSNGFSRVGDCPPPGYGECVWRWDAAIIEVAAVTGFVFILP